MSTPSSARFSAFAWGRTTLIAILAWLAATVVVASVVLTRQNGRRRVCSELPYRGGNLDYSRSVPFVFLIFGSRNAR